MKTQISITLICGIVLGSASCAVAQGTAFTYQGRLIETGSAANGLYEMQFALFDAETNGSRAGLPVTVGPVQVTNGFFTVQLDFGAASFDGAPRWLEITVSLFGSDAAPITLTPRQPVMAAPYAIVARNLSGPLTSNGLSGTYAGAVILNNANNQFVGSFAGDGFALSNLNAVTLAGRTASQFWQITGNSGTISGAHFLGTSDNQPLEFRVNNKRALRLEPASSNDWVNVIAGSARNFVASGAIGATIGGGGGVDSFPGTPNSNSVAGSFSTIGGGNFNQIAGARYGTISGGSANKVADRSDWSIIAGGAANAIDADSLMSAIGGGNANKIGSNCSSSVIAGGIGNRSSALYSVIGGGSSNTNSGNSGTIAGGTRNDIGKFTTGAAVGGGNQNIIHWSQYGTIAGGSYNEIATNADRSVIGGGSDNRIGSNSWYATIPGGQQNFAADHAFAAGTRAKANHHGSFVWGDASSPPFFSDTASTNDNSVTMRASGGYRLFSDTNLTTGVFLAPGDGSWTAISDRNAKENFAPVNARAVLDKVAALPLSTWNYKAQPRTVRHIGPMAQDFKAAFDVGESDTGITTIDLDGVALAAIQALNQKIDEQAQQLGAKETELQSLKQRLDALERALGTLTTRAP